MFVYITFVYITFVYITFVYITYKFYGCTYLVMLLAIFSSDSNGQKRTNIQNGLMTKPLVIGSKTQLIFIPKCLISILEKSVGADIPLSWPKGLLLFWP